MLPGHDKKRSPKFVDLTFSHDLVAFVVLIVQLFHMLLQLLDLPWMWHRGGLRISCMEQGNTKLFVGWHCAYIRIRLNHQRALGIGITQLSDEGPEFP